MWPTSCRAQQPVFRRRPGHCPKARAPLSLDELKEPLSASALRDRQRRERRSIGGERIRGQPSDLVHRRDIGRIPGAQDRGAASKGVTLSSSPDVTQPHACALGSEMAPSRFPPQSRHAFHTMYIVIRLSYYEVLGKRDIASSELSDLGVGIGAGVLRNTLGYDLMLPGVLAGEGAPSILPKARGVRPALRAPAIRGMPTASIRDVFAPAS